jgi:hypothetical protein
MCGSPLSKTLHLDIYVFFQSSVRASNGSLHVSFLSCRKRTRILTMTSPASFPFQQILELQGDQIMWTSHQNRLPIVDASKPTQSRVVLSPGLFKRYFSSAHVFLPLCLKLYLLCSNMQRRKKHVSSFSVLFKIYDVDAMSVI